MSRYEFTRLAAGDLHEIWDYIAEDDVDAADRVIAEIHRSLNILAEFPEMGHRRDDLADAALRVWPVHSYLIVYRPDEHPLQVVRVISGFRDLFPLAARG